MSAASDIPVSIRVLSALRRRLQKDTRSMLECGRLAWFGLTETVTGLFWLLSLPLKLVYPRFGQHALAEMSGNSCRQLKWAGSGYVPQYRAHGRDPVPASLDQILDDPARARDIAWHLASPFGVIQRLAQIGIPTLFTLVTVSTFDTLNSVGITYYFLEYSGRLALFVTVPYLLLAPIIARLDQRLHRGWVLKRLGGREELLTQRVEELTATRRSALELQELEIRRIERDLHDGAQARIVAMGMTLTQVQRLLEVDPEGAKELLAAAKQDSSAALGELRSLVRGIRPPLLADRGLTAAVKSLAAGSPIDTRVASHLSGRLVPTLETAAYFAIAELVTNAVKHSAASEIVIELDQRDGCLEAIVTDNGIGGVTERPDGGLAGIRQRLAPFDGTLDGVSPVGGPTVVRIRIPLPLD